MIASLAAEEFEKRFGADPEVISVAPGRANLIGEHTDYNDGYVFPVAIDRGVAVAMRRSEGNSTRLFSLQQGEARSFDVQIKEKLKHDDWGVYPASMAWAITERYQVKVPNVDAVVCSDLPIGSGLSSSAAIEMAFGKAWVHLLNLELSSLELAEVGQMGENQYVGVRCGIMDQLASACGMPGQAMFVDVRTMELRYVSIPDHYRIVLCDTQAPRKLKNSAYNQRREECESAARTLGLAKLRDATLDDLIAKQELFEPIPFKRARHVVTENNRCLSFFWALADSNELRIGLLMRASHESLREDFEVTSKQLDAMAESCWLAPGCIGARMTGAGFGGACIALVKQDVVDLFTRSVANQYQAKTGIEPQFLICRPSAGAHIVNQK